MSFDRTISLLLTTCALAITGILVHREFTATTKPANRNELVATRMANWRALPSFGVELSPGNGKLQLVEFTDLQCPFCRKFDSTLSIVQKDLGDAIGVTLIHTPLVEIHKYAQKAAQAAECARQQGRAREFIAAAFAAQDSFASIGIERLGTRSGVPNKEAFDACLQGPLLPVLALGRRLADSLDLHTTPIVVLNGWRFSRAPNAVELKNAVGRVLTDRDPVGR